MGEAPNQLLREHKHHLKKSLAFQSPCMPSQPQRERAGGLVVRGKKKNRPMGEEERERGGSRGEGGLTLVVFAIYYYCTDSTSPRVLCIYRHFLI